MGANCKTCELACKEPIYYNDFKNLHDIDIMFVFSNPNKWEFNNCGINDQDKQLLKEVLEFYGIPFTKCYFTSLVKHYVEDKKLKAKHIKSCLPLLQEEIKMLKPKIIVGLGKDATKVISGKNKAFSFVRGYVNYIESKSGKFFNINTIEPKKVLAYYPHFVDFKTDIIKLSDLYKELTGQKFEVTTRLKNKWTKPVLNVPFNPGNESLDFLIGRNTPLTFDIETSGLRKGGTVLKIGLTDIENNNHYIIDEPFISNPDNHNLIENILSTNKLVCQNGKFDIRYICQASNISLDINKLSVWFDTFIAHIMIDGRVGTHSLKTWAKEFFNAHDWESDIKKYLPNKNSSYSLIPSNILSIYLSYDLLYTTLGYKLFDRMLDQEETRSYYNILMQAFNIFIQIEYKGIRVSHNLKTVKRELEEQQEKSLKFLTELAYKYGFTPEKYQQSTGAKTLPKFGEFNPNSPKQAQFLFYDLINSQEGKNFIPEFEVEPGEFKKSCCKEAVEAYKSKHPLWSALYDFKNYGDVSFMKALDEKMDDDHRIRTSFLLAVVTGRMSSQGFNMQNLKRGSKIKNLLLPEKDSYLIDIDYNTLEVIVAGMLSKDPEILKVFKEGGDFHALSTEGIFPDMLEQFREMTENGDLQGMYDLINKESLLAEAREKLLQEGNISKLMIKVFKELRQKSKAVTFGVLYRRGAKDLAKQELNCEPHEAQFFINNFNKKFNVYKAWSDDRGEFALENGYVKTFFGHKRRFPFIYEGNKHEIIRQSANTEVQGTASQLTLTSIMRIHERFKIEAPKSFIMFTVHDSIVGSVHKSELQTGIKIMYEEMTKNPIMTNIPLGVEGEIGVNYGEKSALYFDKNLGRFASNNKEIDKDLNIGG